MPAPHLFVNGRPTAVGWLAGALALAAVVGLLVLAVGRARSPQAAAPGPAASPPDAQAPPDFEVKPVSTAEGDANWYDVPANSLPRRRAWPGEMTAASNRLPRDAYVRVRRIDAKADPDKSVVVRITDNGVGRKSTIIDLDREAAEALGIVRAGQVRVRVEVLTLRNASADKPVEKKDAAPAAPKTSELTNQPAATEKQEQDAASAKPQG